MELYSVRDKSSSFGMAHLIRHHFDIKGVWNPKMVAE